MAVEAKRGCGYRKVGGLYLMGGGVSRGCGRMPLGLHVCPACGGGVKQTRGWTWIDPSQLFAGTECDTPRKCDRCPLANLNELTRAGLLWIGKQFYPTPEHFLMEGSTMGICRRISAVPRGFEVGVHWVMLAHPEVEGVTNAEGELVTGPGVFHMFRPSRIEKLVTKTQSEDEEEMEKLRQRNITPVIVPDDDPDHRGTVYDKMEDE